MAQTNITPPTATEHRTTRATPKTGARDTPDRGTQKIQKKNLADKSSSIPFKKSTNRAPPGALLGSRSRAALSTRHEAPRATRERHNIL